MTIDERVEEAADRIAKYAIAGMLSSDEFITFLSALIREAEKRGAIEAAEGSEIEGETEHLSEDWLAGYSQALHVVKLTASSIAGEYDED